MIPEPILTTLRAALYACKTRVDPPLSAEALADVQQALVWLATTGAQGQPDKPQRSTS